jgi:hypothetical protein
VSSSAQRGIGVGMGGPLRHRGVMPATGQRCNVPSRPPGTPVVVRAGGGDVTQQMTEQATDSLDELGPVDWIVVEFPGSRFRGEIAPILDELVERGTIRVLDLILIRKGEDGALDFFELSDLDENEMGSLRAYETELAMLLSEDDVTAVAAAVEPGSTAALLVWENRWAAPFGSAVRHAGGQLMASGRIPVQALLAAVEADTGDSDKEGE